MTLELNKVARQVNDVGRMMAQGAARRKAVLPTVRGLLHKMAQDSDRLRELADTSGDSQEPCAMPTEEAVNSRFPVPRPPSIATILAADGSQIYPDPHGLVPYYVINTGSVVYRHGSGQAPAVATEAQMAYAVRDDGTPFTSELVNARRDVAELTKLADLAEEEQSDLPLVALLDSTLSLRAGGSGFPPAEREPLQQTYTGQMRRLFSSRAALAGVISRSRQRPMLSLIERYLSSQGVDHSLESVALQGMTDQMLWADLLPGERSPLMCQSGDSDGFFFYLNTESVDMTLDVEMEAEPARIEIPDWVAHRAERVDWVHSLVYDQCQINNGYPYVLSRADELAIILSEEREALEMMIVQTMNRHGMPLPRLSYKARQKRVARAPLRRRS